MHPERSFHRFVQSRKPHSVVNLRALCLQAVWRTLLTGFLWDCMCLPCLSTSRDFPSKMDLRSSEAFKSIHEADLFSSSICWVCVDHVQQNRMKSITMFLMEFMIMFSTTFMQRLKRRTDVSDVVVCGTVYPPNPNTGYICFRFDCFFLGPDRHFSSYSFWVEICRNMLFSSHW